MHKTIYICRTCGFNLKDDYAPWGEDGTAASFEICHCCGVQFGYEDAKLEAIKLYREQWIKNGCIWFIKKEKPDNWSLDQQLSNIPIKYL